MKKPQVLPRLQTVVQTATRRENVTLEIMEVRPTYTNFDGYYYHGLPMWVVTAFVDDDYKKARQVQLRHQKLKSGVVYQVGDAFPSVDRATLEMTLIDKVRDWQVWRWLRLELVK